MRINVGDRIQIVDRNLQVCWKFGTILSKDMYNISNNTTKYSVAIDGFNTPFHLYDNQILLIERANRPIYDHLNIPEEIINMDVKSMYPQTMTLEEISLKLDPSLFRINNKKESNMLKGKIEKVIFNDPATIVFWKDGTKTVVKAGSKPIDISNDCWNEDKFDPEKGLAMAIAKKALGNEGNYYNEFRKWLPEKDEEEHD